MVRTSEGETETETEGWEASAACSSGIRVSCSSTTEALILLNLGNLDTLQPLKLLKFTTWGYLKERVLVLEGEIEGVVLGTKGRVENVERVAITTAAAASVGVLKDDDCVICNKEQQDRIRGQGLLVIRRHTPINIFLVKVVTKK